MSVVAGDLFLKGVGGKPRGKLLLGAEAVVRTALFHKLLRVLKVHPHAFALDIGAVFAAHIGALVPRHGCVPQGVVDDIDRALHIPLAVGILDAQDKAAAVASGEQIGVQSGSQIAHMHIAGGTGRKARSYLFQMWFPFSCEMLRRAQLHTETL